MRRAKGERMGPNNVKRGTVGTVGIVVTVGDLLGCFQSYFSANRESGLHC